MNKLEYISELNSYKKLRDFNYFLRHICPYFLHNLVTIIRVKSVTARPSSRKSQRQLGRVKNTYQIRYTDFIQRNRVVFLTSRWTLAFC